jgi:hypothetical protein
MPTGYTADVVDGKITKFSDFAMRCARAFGACITMRDEASDAPIPEKFEPSDYYSNKICDLMNELYALKEMTPEQVEESCNADYVEKLNSEQMHKEERVLENARLSAMEQQVSLWHPPSSDHNGLKTFMLQQLDISKHDLAWHDVYAKVEKTNPNDWLSERLKNVRHDIEYYSKEYEEECKKTEKRNLWIKQLRDSLGDK